MFSPQYRESKKTSLPACSEFALESKNVTCNTSSTLRYFTFDITAGRYHVHVIARVHSLSHTNDPSSPVGELCVHRNRSTRNTPVGFVLVWLSQMLCRYASALRTAARSQSRPRQLSGTQSISSQVSCPMGRGSIPPAPRFQACGKGR